MCGAFMALRIFDDDTSIITTREMSSTSSKSLVVVGGNGNGNDKKVADKKTTGKEKITSSQSINTNTNTNTNINMNTKLALRQTGVSATLLLMPPVAQNSTSSHGTDGSVICNLQTPLSFSIKNVRVKSFKEGRRNVSSLTICASKVVLNNLMDLDSIFLDQAKKDANDWFGTSNSVSRIASVDEFFRASTATDRDDGVVAKFSMDFSRGAKAPPFNWVQGDDIDIVMQLVGLRFLRQHVDLTWRLVAATKSDGPFIQHGVRSDSGSDDEDVDILGPTPEERDEMFCELFSRINSDRSKTDARLRDLDSLTDSLEDGRDAGDAKILEVIRDRYEAMSQV